MGPELVVLQHDPRTGPDAFVEVLDARASRAPWRVIDVTTERLPAPDGLAGVVSLGGPQGVPDAEEHPWMADEQELLAGAVAAEIPVLGVCLGAQVLASALGGEVRRREVPVTGFMPLDRTEDAGDDDVAAGWPDGTAPLFFHQDEVATLPDEARPLLTGADGRAAGWRAGSGLAVQFHPEATADQLERWLQSSALATQVERGPGKDALLAEARRRDPFSIAQGRALLGRWLDGPVRRHLQA